MSQRKIMDPWTGYVVGRLHRYSITQYELASVCHYKPEYLSKVLNCRQNFKNEESMEKTKHVICEALEELIKQIEEGVA